MPDKPLNVNSPFFDGNYPDNDCDAVCIDASRIYDSCGAKDCLSDLPLLLTDADNTKLENACSVRVNKASVITSTLDVEPVAFHRGFYSVDMMFYFSVCVDVYSSTSTIPETVNGLAIYGKRVVLYGSEGRVKSFSSDSPIVCDNPTCDCLCTCGTVPTATVQISDPMALSARLVEGALPLNLVCTAIPECVQNYFGADFVQNPTRYINVTLGIFTITQLQRNVQMSIPSYDFCVPRKECSSQTNDPCEVFSKIEFPTDSFFPPKVGETDKSGNNYDCKCDN